jgi:hypothetical protein
MVASFAGCLLAAGRGLVARILEPSRQFLPRSTVTRFPVGTMRGALALRRFCCVHLRIPNGRD